MFKSIKIAVYPASDRFKSRETRQPIYSAVGDTFAQAVTQLEFNVKQAALRRGKAVIQTPIIEYFADAGLDVEITTDTYQY